MAEKLTEEEARRELAWMTKDPHGRYPWADWADGNWWKIIKGADYFQETDNMRRTVALHAKRHAMTVRIHKRGDALILKFEDSSQTAKERHA